MLVSKYKLKHKKRNSILYREFMIDNKKYILSLKSSDKENLIIAEKALNKQISKIC